MRLRPADLAAIAAFNTGVMRSRAEYTAHPSAGRYDDDTRTYCIECGKPTYSKHSICRACLKGE